MKKLLFSLCIVVWLSACTTINKDKGVTARWHKEVVFNNDEKPTLSFKEASIGARKGNASYQAQLGQMYEYGSEVEQDYDKAEYWYLKAAKQGNTFAQDGLGWIYQYPNSKFHKLIESTYWYRQAAEQGYAPSQDSLGFAYMHGIGIKKDYKKAISWYTKASEQNYAPAQRNLGRLYEKGHGVKKDYVIAVNLYRKAADNGDGRAANYLGIMYRDGIGIQQDRQLALEWFKKSSDKNDYEGTQNFNSLIQLSYAQYSALAMSGNAHAQRELCHMYFNGHEVEVDYERAVMWCTKSAILGYAEAQEDLSRMFLGGSIIKQNYQSAYIWAMAASAQNRELESLATSIRKELTDQELQEAKERYSFCLPPYSKYQSCPKPELLDE